MLAWETDDSRQPALRGSFQGRVCSASALRFWVNLGALFLSFLAIRADVPVWFGNRNRFYRVVDLSP